MNQKNCLINKLSQNVIKKVKKITLKEVIELAKNGDKVAIKFLEDALIRYDDYFKGLVYVVNDTINKQNKKIQKEEIKKNMKN